MFMSHPPVSTAAVTRTARVDARSIGISRNERIWGRLLVGDLDDGRVGPELWILEPVHPDLERVAEEARDLRVEPRVFGDREQVPADEPEPHFGQRVQPDRPQLTAWEGVLHAQLFQLGV